MIHIFGWGLTPTERKRDQYYQLYEELCDGLSKHDQKATEANDANCSYLNSVPNLSNSMIPSNDFDSKREELHGKLNGYFQYDLEKRTSIVAAKNKAWDRYIHYKNLAMKEAAEKEAAEKAAKEKAKGR